MKKEFKYTIDGTQYEVSILDIEGQQVKLEVNGKAYTATLPETEKQKVKPQIAKPIPSEEPKEVRKPINTGGNTAKGIGIKAPLPGVIIDVLVNVGDTVKRGQQVATLEAMKMENNIESDCDGTVIEVKVKKGDSIMEGMDIVVIG